MNSIRTVQFALPLLMTVVTYGQGLIIPSGSYVVATGNIVLRENLVNNGSFTAYSNTVAFMGTTQAIRGTSPTVFDNLTIGSGSNTTIDSPFQSLKSVLLCNGTLNADGNLTLLSTSTRTALIDGSGSGNVAGNVAMQRHLDSSYGYKFICSAFQDATIAQVSGYISLADSFSRFYKYVEDVNHTGWVRDTTASDTIKPMAGYAANFGTSFAASTYSLHGVVNNGSTSSTLYNHNQAFTQGFNLVGNPYPSPIDWDATSGWTKINLDNAIYYYDAGDTNQFYGTYSSYIGGVSSNGRANNIIPAMQGYFIHVSSGSYPVSGTLASTNSVRINNLAPVYHKPSSAEVPLLRLKAAFGSNGKADPVAVYFSDEARGTFNNLLDAIKMMNTDDLVPNLYAVSTDEKKLSINAVPYLADSLQVVPLGLSIVRSGDIVFDGRDIEHLPAGMHVYLSDIAARINQDLSSDPIYSLKLDAGKYEGRFFLCFRPAGMNAGILSGEIWNAYGSGGMLNVNLYQQSGGQGDVMVSNLAGQVLLRQHIVGYGLHQFNARWPEGIYVVTLNSNGTRYSKKVFINN